MNTRTIAQKLKSTKLWTCLIGVAVGLYIYLGGDAEAVQTVAGAITSALSVITYIVTEGRIDAAAAGKDQEGGHA